MKNEGDVKKEVKKILNAIDNCWWYMPVQTGYGVKGIPDFICSVRGTLVGIETKFGNNKESPWQKRQGEGILNSGGIYVVINNKNIGTLTEILTNI
jgi:hypothetical protein